MDERLEVPSLVVAAGVACVVCALVRWCVGAGAGAEASQVHLHVLRGV